MPNYVAALPVGAYGFRPTFVNYTRTGKDGAEVIVKMFGGGPFVGEVLGGDWDKGYDPAMLGPVTFKVTGGQLQITGRSNAGGTDRHAWLWNKYCVAWPKETVIDVHLQLPGHTAANVIYSFFYLVPTYSPTTNPQYENNWLRVTLLTTSTTYSIQLAKNINGTITWMVFAINVTNLQGTFRLKLQEQVAGHNHTHVYYHDGSGSVNEETDEVTLSPFTLAVNFDYGHPCMGMLSNEATNRTISSNGITVTYADNPFRSLYELAAANSLLGKCRVYDTMGSGNEADWLEVFNPTHVFVGDIVAQNGLIRVIPTKAGTFKLYIWKAATSSWLLFMDIFSFYLYVSGVNTTYCFPRSIKTISEYQVTFALRMDSSASGAGLQYVDAQVVLRRGSYLIEVTPLASYPLQKIYPRYQHSGPRRWGYCGDAETKGIMDYVLIGGTSDIQNTTESDNFFANFQDTSEAFIAVMAASLKPDYCFWISCWVELALLCVTPSMFGTQFFLGIIPFAPIADLFKEAEYATISAATRLYFDGSGEDTVTENQAAKWAATTNCSIAINDTARHNVGSYDLKVTGTAAGAVLTTCTPAAPLAKLTKFDKLKIWLSRSGATYPASVEIRLRKDASNYVSKTVTITASAVQYVIDLPHSATDLQGWTMVGSVNCLDFATLTLGWTAVGASEIIYVDGLHEFIDTTTSRGRGETLSNSSAVVFDASGEYVNWQLSSALCSTPGRYLCMIRAKDTDQVASDLSIDVYNNTDSRFLNQDNASTSKTFASTFKYYQVLFEITSLESGDAVYVRFNKATATENTEFIDYIIIFPIGNGQDWPQDQAHDAMRTVSSDRRVFLRT